MIIYICMRLGWLWLPRAAFTTTYRPSSEKDRRIEQAIRNRLRKALYNTKRRL